MTMTVRLRSQRLARRQMGTLTCYWCGAGHANAQAIADFIGTAAEGQNAATGLMKVQADTAVEATETAYLTGGAKC